MLTNSTVICSLPGRTGCCTELIDRYYYNKESNECIYFTYSGCGGNRNNFESLKLCTQICMGIKTSWTIGSASPSDNVGFSVYHYIGFGMIVIVLVVLCFLYGLRMIKNETVFEPHQYKVIISNPNHQYHTRECLFIQGIAKQALQSDIKQLFQDYGKIQNFEFRQTRGDQLNICFIEFSSADDAHRAMHQLNGYEVEGRTLCVIPGAEYTPNTHLDPQTNKLKITTQRKAPFHRIKSNTVDHLSPADIIQKENDRTRSHPTVETDLFSLSMNQVDSDFHDYGDDEAEDIRAFSDSDQIAFGSHLEKHQMNALQQFVKKKLTIEENIETHYDQNWNRIQIDDVDHEYVGIAIDDEFEND
eukprot:55338_1